jgi:hypothetical protein
MMFDGTDPGRPGLAVEIRPDARDLDRLRQPDWLSGPVS